MNAIVKPQQHDRRKFIGGADIAAILGVSPWRSIVDLWADKVEPPSGEARKRLFLRGERWESVVAEMLTLSLKEDGHEVEIIGRNRRFIDTEHPMFAAEIDYEIRLDGEPDTTNVEIKTVHPFKAYEWGESGTDDVPLWYTAQAMWGLGVAPDARKRCIVAPLFGADELRTFIVERDDETIGALRSRALSFWNDHVIPHVPPDPATVEDLDRLFPKHRTPSLIADADLEDAVLRLRAIKAEIKARESEGEQLEFQIKRAMGDCAELLIGGKPAVTWKNRGRTWLDQGALKEAHPDIHREFTRKGETRVFIVK